MNETMIAYFILWTFVTFLLLPLGVFVDTYKDAVITSLIVELVLAFIVGVVFSVGWAIKVISS